jgi:hypothetical protein
MLGFGPRKIFCFLERVRQAGGEGEFRAVDAIHASEIKFIKGS